MHDVVVVLNVEQNGGSRCAPHHHEGSKVSVVKLPFEICTNVDDEADETEEETSCNEGDT